MNEIQDGRDVRYTKAGRGNEVVVTVDTQKSNMDDLSVREKARIEDRPSKCDVRPQIPSSNRKNAARSARECSNGPHRRRLL